MKEYKIIVNFEDNEITSELNDLVQNDYNSIKLNFEIDKEYDKALFELKYPSDNTCQLLIKDNTLIMPKGYLNEIGEYAYEISIYGSDSKLTHFKTQYFDVREELVKDNEEIVNNDRYPILSDLMNENIKLLNEFKTQLAGLELFKEEIRNDINLKGPKGDPFTYEDFTPEQLEKLKGEKGDPLTYEDLTEEQLNDLKTSIAENLEFENYDDTEVKNRLTKIEEILFLKATASISIIDSVITLTINANKQLLELDGYVLSENKKMLTKTITENANGEVTITSVDGEELTLSYEKAPEITINISNEVEPKPPQNEPVTVTITADKEIKEIDGWTLSENKKVLSKIVYEIETNKTITIYDLQGNSVTTKYSVYDVDAIAPEIKKIATETSGEDIKVKINLTENCYMPGESWSCTREPSKQFWKIFTALELETGVEETLMFKDIAGNKVFKKINLILVNNELSSAHETVEHTEHNYGDNIETYEQSENNTHNHITKQVCSVCGQENIISNIIETCIDSELQNIETDEDHCYIKVKNCTICNQETYRDAPEHIKGEPDEFGVIQCTKCGKELGTETTDILAPPAPPTPTT